MILNKGLTLNFKDFAVAYVSGWLKRKFVDLMYDDDDNVIDY